MNFLKLLVSIFFLLIAVGCKTKTAQNNEALKVEDTLQKEKSHTKTNNQQQINYFTINNDNELDLEESNLKINIEDYHSNNSYKYIVKENNFSVLTLFSYYEFGNYDQYIITIDKSNNQISKELVYYNTAPDGNVEEYEYSNFRLSKNLDLVVFKVKVKEDLETNTIIKKDTVTTKYIIGKEGKIIKI